MEKFQIYFFTAAFLAVLVLAFFIFLPFLVPLSIAATLAVLFHKFHERLAHMLGGRRGLAAFFTVVAVIIVIILPLFFIGKLVIQEAVVFSGQLGSGGSGGISGALSSAQERLAVYFPGVSLNLNEYLRLGADWISQNTGTFFAGVAMVTINFLLSAFIGIIAFYYFLKDGKELIKAIVSLSPLPDNRDIEILNKLETTIVSVVRGSLVIAVVQGILAWLGLSIFGVPSPAFLGATAALTSLIPGVGTALVMIPAIIYLFLTSTVGYALGLLVWQIVVVSLVDNMLSPMLIRRGMKVHPLLILLSVMGGLVFFGPVGFLLGPLVLSLLFAMIEIYKFLLGSEKKSFG